MAKNEMVVLTMEAVNELSNKELKKQVTNYVGAGQNIFNSRWVMAEAIYNVVRDELFEEDFETETEFYNFVNLKKSNASQLVNAVEFMRRENLDYNAYTVGKAYALSTLVQDEYWEFMDYCNRLDICTHSMSDKALANLIKEWKLSQLEEVEAEEVEAEDVEAEESEQELDEKETALISIVLMMREHNITIEEIARALEE